MQSSVLFSAGKTHPLAWETILIAIPLLRYSAFMKSPAMTSKDRLCHLSDVRKVQIEISQSGRSSKLAPSEDHGGVLSALFVGDRRSIAPLLVCSVELALSSSCVYNIFFPPSSLSFPPLLLITSILSQKPIPDNLIELPKHN